MAILFTPEKNRSASPSISSVLLCCCHSLHFGLSSRFGLCLGPGLMHWWKGTHFFTGKFPILLLSASFWPIHPNPTMSQVLSLKRSLSQQLLPRRGLTFSL